MTRTRSCTCSSSRVDHVALAVAPSSTTAASRTGATTLQNKNGEHQIIKHVGTFHYHHFDATDDNPNPNDHSHCSPDLSLLEKVDCSSLGSYGVATGNQKSCSPVVTAEVVDETTIDSDSFSVEDLPALTISADAVVDVPALCLSLLPSKGEVMSSTTSTCTPGQQRHQEHAACLPLTNTVTVLPEVVATPVDAVQTCCMYESTGNNGDAWTRPQFLSATVVRTSIDEKFGIKFHCDPQTSKKKKKRRYRHHHKHNNDDSSSNSYPKISQIIHEEGGLLSQAPFCVGDVLISINKQSCRGIPPDQFTNWLSQLTGTITFVVQHPGGDPTLVESFLRKPRPQSKTGIGLIYSPRQNLLRVKQVHYAGLLVEGLLQVEDRIVAINHIPCQYWDARTAAEQIARSPLWVSIVARRHCDAGVVLTIHPDATTTSSHHNHSHNNIASSSEDRTTTASNSHRGRRFGLLSRRSPRNHRQSQGRQLTHQSSSSSTTTPTPIIEVSFSSTAEC